MRNIENFPGSDFIIAGIEDLKAGNNETIGALMIAIASQRLSQAGLEFPIDRIAVAPEEKLYGLLEDLVDDPYPYYNSLLVLLDSFCSALEK